MSKKEWLTLEKINDEVIQQLCDEAGKVRDTHWGKNITYSRKVFLPLTNMCRDECGYCTFVEHPDSPRANIMSLNDVSDTLRRGEQLDCKEALFSLGEKPEQRYGKAASMLGKLGYSRMVDYLRDACEFTLKETRLIPHVNCGTLNESEIRLLKPVAASMGMMLESLSLDLMKKGSAHHRCPDKTPKLRMQTLELTGKHQVPFTTGLLIGIGETWADRIQALQAINRIHLQYGHIQEVIIQNFRAKPGTLMANHSEPDLHEMVKTLAVARLILDPSISIQAPPNLHERHAVYIQSGINDWGGISPVTQDFINPECAWPDLQKLSQSTAEHGYQLRERLTVYPSYLRRAGYVSPALGQRLIARSDESGLARVSSF
ncbi:7,8-didemethyl-8-hydroxy-5-deazariboflavin synthase CofG [Pseudomaricurvus sp.]|uniref:7,8-didemethyl-8-hydroxy-5-deazariboflavin synthase CofG n=1 Tax=Pseudomaricurvus sp. TaxID=2004510 RepID=UPI003F6C2A7D